ncbi:MAG: type 1 glutamine amidotransferase domain-containing protein [Gammaproteobacteria bacterium]
MIKKIVLGLTGVVVIVAASGAWFFSLLDRSYRAENFASFTPRQLPYLAGAVKEQRGKILAVVTSANRMGTSDKSTGYELTELSRAYYVFVANGFEVDIASPQGGEPPVVIDDDDMGPYDYAFLNDPVARQKVVATIPTAQVNAADYAAVYFVGGKGAMFDFPDDPAIQQLVKNLYQNDKVVGAVCHGPAALVNVTLDDGRGLLENKKVSSFTNDEELFLIPDARDLFPFLLQDKLIAGGATFEAGLTYLEQVSHDGNLITGQNPWSVWPLAEAMIAQLGYTPIPRQITGDEHSVAILATYQEQGYATAREQLEMLVGRQQANVNRNLIAMHGIVAAMRGDVASSFQLVRLVAVAKRLQESTP